MKYEIRKTTIEDMKMVEDAHRRSIIELCSKDYSKEQIKSYSNVNYSKEVWNESVTKDFHEIVITNGKVEGFCHSRIKENGDGEILGLYLTQTVSNKGIGRELVQRAIIKLIDVNIKKITLTANKTAKEFYVKMGFNLITESEIKIRGVILECFRMEMYL